MKKLYLLFLLVYSIAFSQTDSLDNSHYKEKYQIEISKAKSDIKIDGLLDEIAWAEAKPVSDFWNKFPNNVGRPKRKSTVKAAFSDDFIYFSAVLEDTSKYVIQSLKRDVDLWDSDNFIVALDPMNAKTNGFIFSVNPYNVQSEDVFGNNSFEDLTFSWDNKWFSATKRYADHWVVELAIPFKTLRYSPTKDTWGVSFIRCDLKNFQYSTWVHMPTQFIGYDPGWMGALKWKELPKSAGRNVSIIPFVTSSAIKTDETETKASAGLDAKIALNSSLNLDLTVNPDFSQVEVDQQVTNLTRFNIFLPERRTFFLENADLFSNYGFPGAKPFYSRSIGLDRDGRSIPIIGGFRVSGNATKLLRVGLMNMQTGGRGKKGTEDFVNPQNYTAASFNQTVGTRSVIKGYLLNKQATGILNKENPLDAYGRNAGAELNFTDNSGKYSAWANLHNSWKPTITNKNKFAEFGLAYFGNNFNYITDYSNFGENYYTDMGYVSQIETEIVKGASYDDGEGFVRMGFDQTFNETSYTLRPTKGIFNKHEFGISDFRVRRQKQWTDKLTEIGYEMGFKNSSELSIGYTLNKTILLFYTPLPDKNPLEPGNYRYNTSAIEYSSDGRKLFFYSLSAMKGGFYSGEISQVSSKITTRAQPWGNFSLSYEFNDLKFDEKYGNARFNLLNARSEISFSNNIFWTTFLQYNTQRNNFNVNSRFQWRYKPMSDLFLVFTDNYMVDPTLKNRDRAIVLKLNYWLTI